MSQAVTLSEGALQKAADHLGVVRADLDREISALDQKLRALAVAWSGGGAFAFVELREQWQIRALQLIAALEAFEGDLRSAMVTYSRAEQAAETGMNRLANRLGSLPGV